MLATKIARRAILVLNSLAAFLPHFIFHRMKTIIRDQRFSFLLVYDRVTTIHDYSPAHSRVPISTVRCPFLTEDFFLAAGQCEFKEPSL